MADLDELWQQNQVIFFSEDPPGDPEDDQVFVPGPPYSYKYRLIPGRHPFALTAAHNYDVTVVLKRGETIVKEIKLGDSPNWKGRRDPLVARDAIADTEDNAKRRANLLFESLEENGFNDTLEGETPPGDYPPFTVGYATFSQNFVADADIDTLIITGHGFATGDGSFQLVKGDGVLPGGLSAGATYWAIAFDANQIKLATTQQNALDDIAVDITDVGEAHATRKINGQNHWKEGFVQVPAFVGKTDIAVETDSLFFEPFDTSDTDNFKVTSEPLYTADAVETLPKMEASKQNYLMLVPQWWKAIVTFTAYVVIKWASPNFRIGLNKPFSVPAAPLAIKSGAGAGNLNNGDYYYVVSWTVNGVETKGGAVSDVVTIIDNSLNGKVTISSIEQGPDGTEARTVYRTTVNGTPDEYRDNFFLVEVIPNNDFGVEVEDNLADGSLGAASLNEYAYPFGNAKENDWFYLAEDDEFDLDRGGDPPETFEAGFYFCINEPGEFWDDWQFCAADAVTPPNSGCFDYDKVRYRLAQATRECTAEFFKKALTRPVFPMETDEYATSGITPVFTKLALEYQAGIPFEDEGVFTEDSATLETDDYQSLVITEELADAEPLRALAYWAENCVAFERYFEKQYLVDIGIYTDLESVTFDGELFDEIGAVDPSFDISLANAGPGPTSDHIFIEPNSFGTSQPSHWWSKDGLLNVERANTPAGSLVAALQVKTGNTENRFYVWRKTDSTDRSGVIVENVPFSTQDSISYSELSGEDPEIPRQRIRSSTDGPPDSGIDWDYEF
jgi:hypothetical protein